VLFHIVVELSTKILEATTVPLIVRLHNAPSIPVIFKLHEKVLDFLKLMVLFAGEVERKEIDTIVPST